MLNLPQKETAMFKYTVKQPKVQQAFKMYFGCGPDTIYRIDYLPAYLRMFAWDEFDNLCELYNDMDPKDIAIELYNLR